MSFGLDLTPVIKAMKEMAESNNRLAKALEEQNDLTRRRLEREAA